MQVLVLVAPRNGIGRTTLVHRLAQQANRAGAGPIVLLDADPRGDLSERCAEKAQPDIIVVPWDDSCIGPEFQQLKARNGGLIIVDAPLPDQPKALHQVLSIADLIAVLVRPREDDVALLGGVVDAIKLAARPLVFVVNRAKRHGNMAAATAIALAQYGTVCPVILPEDEPVAPSLRAKVFRKIKRTDGQLKREQFWEYLSGRLEALHGELLHGEAGPTAGNDTTEGGRERRKFPRYSYDIGATFTWDRRVFPCRIKNISAGGLALTADISVPLGTRLKLHLPYLGEFDAISVHRDATSAGLRFVIDEWQQAELVRDLTNLVASGGGSAKSAGGSRQSRKAEAGDKGAGAGTGAPEDKAKGTKVKNRARG
jgi:chromosome partitioning protein